jgi:hypothetical protein
MEAPCAVCGRETGPVDGAYIERLTVENLFGPELYLCADCAEAIRLAYPDHAPSDDVLRDLVREGSAASIAASSFR